jgi:WD40 repeat protein
MTNDPTASYRLRHDLDEVLADYLEAARVGRAPRQRELLARHPELAGELEDFFADDALVRDLAEPLRLDAAAVRTPLPSGVEIALLHPGDMPHVFGDYEVLELLATSGMGVVFRARQVSLDRIVALKMVRPGGREPDDLERFLHTEARAVAGLDHPHIVPIYDFGTFDGQPFFSMKLLDGGDLARRLRADPPLSQRDAARLLVTVARAVHHAHQRGVLHRDLKPSNILLDRAGRPHVADFGLAKRVEGDCATTHSGSITGTPSYMAPEQAAAASVLTTAVDVYGLGAVLYELLTGQPPFRAATPVDTILQARTQDPPPPCSLNPKADRDLETVCLKCLEKDPARRYGSAEALAADLDRWLRGEPIVARPAPAWEQLAKWTKRRPGVSALLGVAAALLLAALGVLAWGWQQASSAQHLEKQKAVAEAEARRAAEKEAAAEKRRAAEAARGERLVQAHLALEKGTNRIDRGEVAAGMLWLARGLEVAPDDAADLRRSLRTLLGGWTRAVPTLKAVARHDGRVNTMVFSPDGKKVLTASDDKTARLWDAATGEPLTDPLRHDGPVNWAAFSPDGASVVTANLDDGVHLWGWDAATGKRLGKIIAFRAVFFVVLSPDGKTVAVGQQFHNEAVETQLWDLTTGKLTGRIVLTTKSLDGAAFSPDGTKLLVGCGPQAELIDVAKAKDIAVVTLGDRGAASITCLAFSPDSKIAVAANNLGTARLWDAGTGKPRGEPITHGNWIWSAAFRPDGKALLTAGSDETARLWDTNTGKELIDPARNALVEPIAIGALAVGAVYSPDGKIILTRDVDRKVRLWEAATGRLLGAPLGFDARVNALAFGPDGANFLTGDSDGGVRLWELPPRPERRLGEGRFEAVAFSPDGKTLVTACDGVLPNDRGRAGAQRWDVATGEPLGEPLRHGDHGASCLAFSADGKRLATGSERDRSVRVWDAATGRPWGEPCQFPKDDEVRAVAFGPDGKSLLVLSGNDKNRRAVLTRWDPSEGKQLSSTALLGKEQEKWRAWLSLSFSPRGTYCALVYYTELPPRPGTLALFDTATGDVVLQRTEQVGFAEFAFAPGGKRFLTVTKVARAESGGGRCWAEVRLWDVATGRPVSEPTRHLETKYIDMKAGRTVFSPDGRTFVTNDHSDLQFWDAATAKPIGSPLHAPRRVHTLAPDPKGKWLAVAGANDAGVLLIPAPPPLPGDPEHIRLRIEVATGMELDPGGAVVELDAKTWRERWERLQKLGGPPR